MAEGLVVVASILLAFGIDAAWEMRQAAQEDRQLLHPLIAEIEVNREELQYRSSQGSATRGTQIGGRSRTRSNVELLLSAETVG